MSAAFADAVQRREHHDAVSFFVDVQPDVAIVSACNCAHPGIGFVLPGRRWVFRLVVNLHERRSAVVISKEFEKVAEVMSRPVMVDLRNMFDPQELLTNGFNEGELDNSSLPEEAV